MTSRVQERLNGGESGVLSYGETPQPRRPGPVVYTPWPWSDFQDSLRLQPSS